MSKSKYGNLSSISMVGSNKADLIKYPVATSFAISKGKDNDRLEGGLTQSTVSSFEISTGITNNSPEILAISNFIPAYDDNGRLNKVGQVLQAKQDSLLISAEASITSILNSNISSDLSTAASENSLDLKLFCDSFGENIDDLLIRFSRIKKKFDCRSPLDQKDLMLIGALQVYVSNALSKNKVIVDVSPSSIQEILFDSTDNTTGWTPTKTWIQVCLEMKEAFRNGLPGALLTHGAIPSAIPNDQAYSSPYNIVSPRSAALRKFSFNDRHILVPRFLDITGLVSQKNESIFQIMKAVFNSKGVLTNVFNTQVFGETDSIEESIARLSHLICKEYVFSTKMKQTIVEDYGYSINTSGTGNSKIWDSFFGQVGSDITEIFSNPPGGGKSLVSLSQFIEKDNTEVLTFEDSYIKDNIGTKRPNAVITPGTFYYVESSLNSDSNNFDVSRLSSYIQRLKSSAAMLNSLRDDLAFQVDVEPYRKPTQKSHGVGGSNSANSTDLEDILSNPILLLRSIEQKVLNGSGLLCRDPGPKTWSNEGEYEDISAILISTAINDAELMSLLFIFVVGLISANKSKFGASEIQGARPDFQYRSDLALKIVDRLKSIVSFNSQENGKYLFYARDIQGSIEGGIENGVKILENLANFLEGLSDKLDFLETSSSSNFEKFFISSQSSTFKIGDIQQQTDKRSLYSGTQKTIYLSSVFMLCCLLVHSSNPERFVNHYAGNQTFGDVFEIKEVYDPIMVRDATEDKSRSSSSVRSSEGIVSAQKVDQQISRKNLSILKYDAFSVKIENLLSDYDRTLLKKINRIYGFLFSLQREMETLIGLLNPGIGKYSKFLSNVNSVINEPSLTRLLMSEEQLLLVRSKLTDISIRSSNSYSSPVKDSIPYFLNLRNQSGIDKFLPLEDIHLVSWNLLLKDFLKTSNFGLSESSSYNKRIISVGIPQKLQRSLQLNASNLSASTRKNKLVNVKIYRVNGLKPELIYSPISFLFDLTRFSTRVLKNFIDSGFSVFESSSFDLNKIPTLKSNLSSEMSPSNSFSIINNGIESLSDYSFLSNEDKKKLIENHSISFLMEEYLRYLCGVSFDENRYTNFNVIKKTIDAEFEKFVKSTTGTETATFSNPSMQSFFVEDSFLLDTQALKKSLISPRKFDRVFHLLVDPDDFIVDTTLTESFALTKYQNDSSSGSSLDEITFDKYYAAIETYSDK